MGAWIISITGVICLGILLDIVLPDGKTTKYIRGAFSLIVILVIVSPLPSLLKKSGISLLTIRRFRQATLPKKSKFPICFLVERKNAKKN